MEKFGKILFPEQYAPVGKEVMVSNSREALAIFEASYPKGGMVLLGSLRLDSLEIPELPVWLYFDLKSKEPTLYSTLPVFNVDMKKFGNLRILDIMPHQDEIFLHWNNTLYSSVFTTKGEIVIKKVRLLADETNAKLVLEMQFPTPVTDMLPVELYSHSEHRPIGVCWATYHGFEDDCIYWHPICLDDVKRLAAYPPDDLSDHPIEVGETVTIGKLKLELHYTDKAGFFFRKYIPKNEKPKFVLKKFDDTAPRGKTTGKSIILDVFTSKR